MRRIIEANVVRYKGLLDTESDPAKRVMIARLPGAEEAKQN